MKFPLIKIRDKDTGSEFYLGNDVAHHRLVLDESGNLMFNNIQCCDGTGEDGCYEFVTHQGVWGKEVEFGSVFDVIKTYAEHVGIVWGNPLSPLADEYNKAFHVLAAVFKKAEDMQEERRNKLIQSITRRDGE